MRAVVQRVRTAAVEVGGETVGAVGAGVLVLVGVGHADDEVAADRLAGKVARLRIFPDADGRLDRSLLDVDGDALVVSQFTLLGDATRGNRPSFTAAARPEQAAPLVERVAAALRGLGVRRVETGRFGAEMAVSLVNDGPVTILLEV